MKKYSYYLIYLVSIIIILYSLYSINANLHLPIETKVLQVTYIAGPITGFDVNSSALKFGQIMRGSSSVRTVILENNHNFPIEVTFVPSKNLNYVMNFNRSRQRIEINETRTFPVILTVPVDQAFGNYSGNFSALIYKVEN